MILQPQTLSALREAFSLHLSPSVLHLIIQDVGLKLYAVKEGDTPETSWDAALRYAMSQGHGPLTQFIQAAGRRAPVTRNIVGAALIELQAEDAPATAAMATHPPPAQGSAPPPEPSHSRDSTTSGPYDAFISYRRQEPDKAFARSVRQHLIAHGFSVAFDEVDFQPNHSFLQEMERCIRQSRFVLTVLSPRYLESGNTEEEAIITKTMDMAERKRRLVPLHLEHTDLPYWLYGLVGIRFDDEAPIVDPWERLKALLGHPRAETVATSGGGSAEAEPPPSPEERAILTLWSEVQADPTPSPKTERLARALADLLLSDPSPSQHLDPGQIKAIRTFLGNTYALQSWAAFDDRFRRGLPPDLCAATALGLPEEPGTPRLLTLLLLATDPKTHLGPLLTSASTSETSPQAHLDAFLVALNGGPTQALNDLLAETLPQQFRPSPGQSAPLKRPLHGQRWSPLEGMHPLSLGGNERRLELRMPVLPPHNGRGTRPGCLFFTDGEEEVKGTTLSFTLRRDAEGVRPIPTARRPR